MRSVLALTALIAVTTACGGNPPTSPSLPPGVPGFNLSRGFVRATVDGSRWESAAPIVGIGPSSSGPPLLTVVTAPVGTALSVVITGPVAVGTYEAGGASLATFSLYEGFGASWSVGPFSSGGSGTLTVTRATATRVTGTFSFTAVAAQGQTPATRTVTDGTFDLSQ